MCVDMYIYAGNQDVSKIETKNYTKAVADLRPTLRRLQPRYSMWKELLGNFEKFKAIQQDCLNTGFTR